MYILELLSITLIPTLLHTLSFSLSHTDTGTHSLTHNPFLHNFPQALGTECKSRLNSSSSTIHLSTGLLGRKKEESEHVSINHLTPGYIYAHSNEFNKESSPWSNILSGTSSLSPSPIPPPPPRSIPHPFSPPSSYRPPILSSSSLRRLLIVKWQKMLEQRTDGQREDTRCRLSAKIIPWARDLENFISLFIIKLLNLNLTQSFSCWSRAGASCSAYWALLITGIRIHPPLQLPSVGHPIQLFLPFIAWEMIDPGDPCFHIMVSE